MDIDSKIKVIRIKNEDEVKGFYTLLTNGPAKCFKDNKYAVPEYCLKILKEQGINFEILR